MTSLRSGPTKTEVALARRGKSAAMGRERRGRAHLPPTSEVRLLRVGRAAPGVVARVFTWLGEWLGEGLGEGDREDDEPGRRGSVEGPPLLAGACRVREEEEEEEDVDEDDGVVLDEDEDDDDEVEGAEEGEDVASVGALLFSADECRMSRDFSALTSPVLILNIKNMK